ncbi:MAG: hypothetical protein WC107_03600 [Patescibacteria group bacterium]
MTVKAYVLFCSLLVATGLYCLLSRILNIAAEPVLGEKLLYGLCLLAVWAGLWVGVYDGMKRMCLRRILRGISFQLRGLDSQEAKSINRILLHDGMVEGRFGVLIEPADSGREKVIGVCYRAKAWHPEIIVPMSRLGDLSWEIAHLIIAVQSKQRKAERDPTD